MITHIADAVANCLQPCLFGNEDVIQFSRQRRMDRMGQIGWGLQKNSGKTKNHIKTSIDQINPTYRV